MSSFKQIKSLVENTLDLKEKQAIVYALCLKEGFLNPTQISRLSGIKRTTVYVELEELKSKGFLSEKIKGKRRFFVANNPNTLYELLEEEKEKLENKKSLIDQLVSITKDIQKNSHTDLEVLEGKQGLLNLLERILSNKKDGYWYGSPEVMFQVLSEEKLFRLFTWKRMDQKTTSYAITDRSVLKYRKFTENIEGFRQFRFLNEKISESAGFVLFGDFIALITLENEKVRIILIKDRNLEKILEFLFKTLWSYLPKE